jgi:hypothetical protein
MIPREWALSLWGILQIKPEPLTLECFGITRWDERFASLSLIDGVLSI